MERAVALKKLGALLGKKLGYRIDTKAPTNAERGTARAELEATRGEYEKLKEQREARYKAVLDADPEYQSLKAACSEARKRREELSGIMRHYKITVGTSEGIFFAIKAEGNSWEEVIDKLTAKKEAVHG